MRARSSVLHVNVYFGVSSAPTQSYHCGRDLACRVMSFICICECVGFPSVCFFCVAVDCQPSECRSVCTLNVLLIFSIHFCLPVSFFHISPFSISLPLSLTHRGGFHNAITIHIAVQSLYLSPSKSPSLHPNPFLFVCVVPGRGSSEHFWSLTHQNPQTGAWFDSPQVEAVNAAVAAGAARVWSCEEGV